MPFLILSGWNLSDVTQPLDLFSFKEGMSFYPADRSVFKTIDLAYEACREGGSCPVVLNGANEVLVDLFLHGKIRFIDIQNFLIQSDGVPSDEEKPGS